MFSIYQAYLRITSNPFHVTGVKLQDREIENLKKEIDSIGLINTQS
jgi:hypothetical protein